MIYLFTITLILLSCKKANQKQISPGELDQIISRYMEEAVNNSMNQIHGVSLAIKSSFHSYKWSGAAGYSSNEKTNLLEVDQPFRIASITKTFVAVSILRLHEEARLSIYDPLSKYISEAHQKLLIQDGYDPNKIKLYHCLNHTSGLFDYAMNGSPYVSEARKNPQKRWTRTEQLALAMQYGNPNGLPGEKYLYSDTGYILLGEIIESFYEGNLARGIRELIGFDKLGMQHTWLESIEVAPIGMKAQVKRYLRGEDVTDYDPSTDLYGGGGLVSTTEDLTTFLFALFNHEIFKKKPTVELMCTPHKFGTTYVPDKDPRFKDYRYGIWKIKLFGEDAYMHSGLWGTTIIHLEKSNISIAINFTKGWNNQLVKRVSLIAKNQASHE
ncbi:MAG: serine hydrolase [Saprospiraceae bacterium]|nr:serine hydrolase [Saprospiraceae bacterium]